MPPWKVPQNNCHPRIPPSERSLFSTNFVVPYSLLLRPPFFIVLFGLSFRRTSFVFSSGSGRQAFLNGTFPFFLLHFGLPPPNEGSPPLSSDLLPQGPPTTSHSRNRVVVLLVSLDLAPSLLFFPYSLLFFEFFDLFKQISPLPPGFQGESILVSLPELSWAGASFF